jgi:hypothetical protein
MKCECCGQETQLESDLLSEKVDELLERCRARAMHVAVDLNTGEFFVGEHDAGELIHRSGVTVRNRRLHGHPLVHVGRFVGRTPEYALSDLARYEIKLSGVKVPPA